MHRPRVDDPGGERTGREPPGRPHPVRPVAAGVRLGVADRRTSLTDGELLAAAGEASRRIRHDARRDRPMVAAVLPLSTDALVLLVAAVLGDFSLCFVDPAGAAERRAGILAALAPDVVVDATGTSVAERADPADRTARTERAGRYVAMSSGPRAAAPRACSRPGRASGPSCRSVAEALELDAGAAWAEVSHLSYDLAMTNLLIALATGCSIHVSSSLGDRLRPLGFTEKVGATHLRAAPRFIDLAVNERPGTATRSLRVLGLRRRPALRGRRPAGLRPRRPHGRQHLRDQRDRRLRQRRPGARR